MGATWRSANMNLGEVSHIQSKPTPEVMDRYRVLRDRTQGW